MTPTDDMSFVGRPGLFRPEADEVHISCTFTWDKPVAEDLAEDWGRYYKTVRVGGPAYGDPGDPSRTVPWYFTPGKYLQRGCVITSRGCNNKCWFCYVPKREGYIRELPIKDGWNVLDSNLLQCSRQHIESVFAMLKRQEHAPRFTGGLDSALLEDWHVELIRTVSTERIYFAYDKANDYEPLVRAVKMVRQAGMGRSHIGCYTLIGYRNDTFDDAERRLHSVMQLGAMPFAMLWRGETGEYDKTWKQFQRTWANPIIVGSRMQATESSPSRPRKPLDT